LKTIVNHHRKKLYVVLAIVIFMMSSGIVTYFRAPSLNIDSIDDLQQIKQDDRLLVFAPHCDDEVLGPSGLIMNAIKTGIPVKVVLMTNGDNNIFSTDIEFRTLYPTAGEFVKAGEVRQQESIDALKLIGVKEENIIFLGYPDKGIKALYLKHWSVSKPYRSFATHDIKAPYSLIYDPQVVYCGENLEKNIKSIIKSFSPTIIVGPHLDDHHPDHKYGAYFILKALNELYGQSGNRNKPILLTYLVHYPHFPYPQGLRPDNNLLVPFASTFDMQWFKLMLTEEQKTQKKEAINLYHTQLKVPRLQELIRSFIRQNELFEKVDNFTPPTSP
jgi:N-acetyl-1-D-myo-inositol-2-amino-2-deoxy-alpha-D-glucopyranoside deacetylase